MRGLEKSMAAPVQTSKLVYIYRLETSRDRVAPQWAAENVGHKPNFKARLDPYSEANKQNVNCKWLSVKVKTIHSVDFYR